MPGYAHVSNGPWPPPVARWAGGTEATEHCRTTGECESRGRKRSGEIWGQAGLLCPHRVDSAWAGCDIPAGTVGATGPEASSAPAVTPCGKAALPATRPEGISYELRGW